MWKHFKTLINLGITPELDPAQRRAIGLVNRLSLLGMAVFFFFSTVPALIFFGAANVGFDTLAISILGLCLYCNYRNQYAAAKHISMIFGLVAVPVVNLSFGPELLFQLNFISVVLLPLLIFRSRRTQVVYFGITLLIYALTEVYHQHFEPLGFWPAGDGQVVRIGNVFNNIFVIAYLMVWFYRGLQEEYAEELEAKNEILASQKAEISAQHKQLQATQQHLIQSEKMASLGQLTAGIAHEINNPINFITGSLGPLKADLNDIRQGIGDPGELFEEIDDLVGSIEVGATRTKKIVSGLRTFARLDEEEWKPINLHEAIDATLALLGHRLQDRIEVRKDYGDIPQVYCQPGDLNQVFMNLLTNAIDAIENKGVITITTLASGEKVSITFSDTGTGMSPEVKEKIFDPFFTTKDVGSGTGLGLSIAYGIVQNHSGEIEVESSPGKGSSLTVTVPITQHAVQQETS